MFLKKALLSAAVTAMLMPALAQADDLDARIEQFIRDNPEVIMESLNSYIEKEEAARAAQEAELVQSFESVLTDPQGFPVLGNEDASVTITYFFDVNCPYCKRMGGVLSELLEKNEDVRVIHREIPILAPSSEYAARVAMLTWRDAPESYSDLHHGFKAFEGTLTNEDVDAIAQEVLGGEIADEVIAGVASGEDSDWAASKVGESLSLANELGVQGTPFLYVSDGTSFRGAVPLETLQQAVDRATAE